MINNLFILKTESENNKNNDMQNKDSNPQTKLITVIES